MRYVLFVCTHNAGRSQIAQAFFEKYAPRRSTGRVRRPGPCGRDLAGRGRGDARSRDRHRRPQAEEDRARDPAARRQGDHAQLPGQLPLRVGGIEDWEVDDPVGQPLEKVRAIRDDIERRVATWSRSAPTRSAPIAPATPAASHSSCRTLSRSSATSAQPNRSALAPTRSSTSTTTLRFARSCSRLPIGTRASAYAPTIATRWLLRGSWSRATSSPSWPAASPSASFEPASSPCSSSCSCPCSSCSDLLESLQLRRGSAGRIVALPSSSTLTTKRPGSAPREKRSRPFGRCAMIAWVSVRVSIT